MLDSVGAMVACSGLPEVQAIVMDARSRTTVQPIVFRTDANSRSIVPG